MSGRHGEGDGGMGSHGQVAVLPNMWWTWELPQFIWLVVWNIWYFSIYWESSPKLTNFFRGVEAAKDTLLYPIPIFQTSNSSFIARCWMTRTNRDRFNRSPFNAQNLGILRAAAAAQLGVGAWLGNILFSGHSCSIGTRTFCGLGHWSDHFKFHRNHQPVMYDNHRQYEEWINRWIRDFKTCLYGGFLNTTSWQTCNLNWLVVHLVLVWIFGLLPTHMCVWVIFG